MADLPLVVGPFIMPELSDGPHRFRLTVEDAAPFEATMQGQRVRRPWLRAVCSCGWQALELFSIEDNAVWCWREHVRHDVRKERHG